MKKSSTHWVLWVLYIISWIIFVGLGIEAGSFLTNAVFALVKPEAVKYLWKQVDLTNLLQYDRIHFFVVALVLTIVSVLKAVLFYTIIRLLHKKKVSWSQPFNQTLVNFVNTAAAITLLIGIFCNSVMNYTHWLERNGVNMPQIHELHFDGGDVWLFMAIILFIIAQVFKKGIEIQTENELTV
ncbi:MAG: DUF2975 domain-containing protein [Chitinophagaceae bacterium]|nr:DUF2975 domain-containing protein [Chitinophagaceae bacterium]